MIPTTSGPLARRHPAAYIVMALVAAASTLTGWAGPAQAQGGMGISPTTLEVRDAFRGQTYPTSLLLNNENDDGAVEFELQPSGEVADWIEFSQRDSNGVISEPATKFVVAKKSRVTVVVSVAVPATAPNNTYTSNILVVGKAAVDDPSKQSGASVGLALNVPITVGVNGNERRQGVVTDMFVEGAEAGQNQRFKANVKNTGNVTIAGQLDVEIRRGETVVAELTNKGKNTAIAPSQDGVVTVEWPTADQSPGNYTARFRVSDVGGTTAKELGATTLSFRLEPRGTLTRSGAFQELKLLNEPQVGGVAKAAAYFLNTGRIDTKAVFSGELYKDGKLIKSITSLEKFVKQGNRDLVEMNIDVPQSGDYRLVGKMNFEGVESDAKELGFRVGESGSGGGLDPILVAAGAGVVVLGSIVAFALVRRRRKAVHETPSRRPRERVGV